MKATIGNQSLGSQPEPPTSASPGTQSGSPPEPAPAVTANQLLQAMLDHIPDRIYFKDTHSRFLKLSRALAKRLALDDPEKAIGKTDSDFIPADKAREFFEDEQRIIRTGEPLINKIEKQILPNGETAWTSTTKVPLRDEKGTIIGIVGINRDVTSQIRAEEALRRAYDEMEQRVLERTAELGRERLLLRTLVDNLPDYIFVKDTQSRFLITNTACTRQLGAENPDDVVGKTDADFVTPELAKEYFQAEQELMQSGRPYDKQEPFLHKQTGEKRWALTTKVPLRDETGKVIGLMGIARDITVIKDAEKNLETVHRELREVSRQAGMAEVATGVLHNVGNVLNSVNVAAGVLADRVQNSKATGINKLSQLLIEHAADLGRFLQEDQRGRHVPAYLKQLSEHLDAERTEMQKELHDLILNIEHIKEIVATQQNYARVLGVAETLQLSDMVEDAIKIHGGAYERHGIKLIREYQPLPSITVDKHKVMQIIVNFLSNAKYACDATERPDKQVTARLISLNPQRVRIEIVDNGIGIARENLSRIFSQGFTTRKGGHGFGLHSGALAAKELGGAVNVQSEGPGKGSTFSLELPLTPPAHQSKAPVETE